MIPRVILALAFAALFSSIAFAAPMMKIDAKTGEDDDGIKINLDKLKFIPKELLCTLCHRVVEKLQHDLHESPVNFQMNMLKSCDNYPDLEDQVKCRAAFTNRQKIEQLLDPQAPTKMCRAKQLCASDELPMSPEFFPMAGPRPLPQGMEPIPKIEEQPEQSQDPQQSQEQQDPKVEEQQQPQKQEELIPIEAEESQ